MNKYKILFTDLDGTLIKTKSGETFPKGIWDIELRFDVIDTIKKLNPEYVFIVSNQGGIEKGFVDEFHFWVKLDFIGHSIEECCNTAVDYYYCSSNNKYNKNRKPNYGMLEEALTEHDINYDKSEMLMIGDASGKPGQFSDSDKKTAENFGIDYLDVEDFCKINFND